MITHIASMIRITLYSKAVVIHTEEAVLHIIDVTFDCILDRVWAEPLHATLANVVAGADGQALSFGPGAALSEAMLRTERGNILKAGTAIKAMVGNQHLMPITMQLYAAVLPLPTSEEPSRTPYAEARKDPMAAREVQVSQPTATGEHWCSLGVPFGSQRGR